MLGVSPDTLRSWERRFGYPRPRRSAGRHRRFVHAEIAALRDALHEGLSISSAISRVREGIPADPDSLMAALTAFDPARADAALEAALALRSVERAVQEVMLPALVQLGTRAGRGSAAAALAARWADDWLRRMRRLASPPRTAGTVLVADASGDELEAIHVRVLELFVARAGLEVIGLPARATSGLVELISARAPDVAVLAGDRLDDEVLARWAYAARTAGPVRLAAYRSPRARSARPHELPSEPLAAAERLELLAADSAERAHTQRRATRG